MSLPLCDRGGMKKEKSERGGLPDGEELAGLIELGMGKEALSKAAEILAHRAPTPEAVYESIRAISIFDSRPARWKSRMESLIVRLSKTARHQMREGFLLYFGTINHHERAADFIATPKSFSPQAILVAVMSLLELGRKDEARSFLAKVPTTARDDDSWDYLGEAAASVHSAFGNHTEAWQIRRSLPCTSPIGRSIVEGMVKSSLALAISDLENRLTQIEVLASEAVFDETSLIIPGNQNELNCETRDAYRRWRKRLLRLLSKGDLRQYKLENPSL